MKRLQAAVFVASLAAVTPSYAAEAATTRTGLSVALRAAYAWPYGTAFSFQNAGDVDFDSGVDYAIPAWIDATFRLGGGLELGGYFQYAYVKFAAGDEDSGADYRVGAQLNFRLTPRGGIAPWLGIGAGWEWLRNGDSLDGYDFMAQGGVDFRLSESVALGPYVAVTFGQFTNGLPARTEEEWHEWLQVGAKLTFDL
jgi:hypothetical protein